MTLPKGYNAGDKRKRDRKRERKEKLKDIGNLALLLTIPAGIVIIVIGKGVYMSEHKDRHTCGKCGLTEFKQ